MQSPGGGFGGGHGQYAHAAPTYAAVLTLALLEDAKAYDLIDRNALWRWAASCKQPDGGFTMAVGGEEDIRAPYCIMTCVSLLNLPLELPEDCPARREWGFTKFTDGLAEYISSCQTFEGGISGSPGVEAHAAYAFCALATLAIMGEPHDLFHRHLDMPLLLDWLSADQHAPEGGFAGRTNKLVDGCYSHWAGGCWPLVEAAVRMKHGAGREIAGEWRGLFDRQGLARWILNCCQETKWGLLRDKIGKPPDAYHTNYNLAGLAGMQWRSWYSSSTGDRDGDGDGSEPPRPAPYRWECEKVPIPEKSAASAEEVADLQVVWEPGDQLQPVHPVFVIGHAAVRKIRGYFEERPLR
ncbi:CAAX farnesyltransferase (FTase) subunit beta [Ascosphaera acerosa]|nr:CAAX farnesyltransferase (FTase) subunit beta [Ascosphaera acerosa]